MIRWGWALRSGDPGLGVKGSVRRAWCTEDSWNRCSVYAQPSKIWETEWKGNLQKKAFEGKRRVSNSKQKCVPE